MWPLTPYVVCEPKGSNEAGETCHHVYRPLELMRHKTGEVGAAFTSHLEKNETSEYRFWNFWDTEGWKKEIPQAVRVRPEDCENIRRYRDRAIENVEFPFNGSTYLPVLNGPSPAFLDCLGTCATIKVAAAPDGPCFVAKVLRPSNSDEEPESFVRERRCLEEWSPKVPGLISFRGHGRTKGNQTAWSDRPFFLMPYVAKTLRDTVHEVREDRKHALDPAKGGGSVSQTRFSLLKCLARSLYMTERVAAALVEIYEKTRLEVRGRQVHFLHRDIRPENILDAEGGVIHLCDLSAAYFPAPDQPVAFVDEAFESRCHDHSRLSRHYCAPEVWQAPCTFSYKADVFSLGLVLDELLHGQMRDVQKIVFGRAGTSDYPSLYTPPEDAVTRELLADLKSFADGQGAAFDLRELVDNATKGQSDRYDMESFLAAVARHGRIVRRFTAEKCREEIKAALNSDELETLTRAIGTAAAAFGRTVEFPLRLRMVRCEACFDCDKKAYVVDISAQQLPCAQPVLELLSRLETIRPRMGLLDEAQHLAVSEAEAREFLGVVSAALEACPGLIELSPLVCAEGQAYQPHDDFHEGAKNWMDLGGAGEINVEAPPPEPFTADCPPSPGPVGPPPSGLPERVLHFLVTGHDPAGHDGPHQSLRGNA
ncbi:MAG: protein kinase [Alphaproteobacteria bacterium]|nr:protein kinase [Alphaproteobacteria bacterium]